MKRLTAFVLLSFALLFQGSSRATSAPVDLFRAVGYHAAARTDPFWRDGVGRAYVHRGNVTFPWARTGRRLSFTSPCSGAIRVSVSCWSDRGGTARLFVTTAADRASCRGRAELTPGLNQLGFSFPAARRQRIAIVCSTDCIFAPPLVYRKIAARQRRNIFLISVDNLGAGHMSCYGYSRKTTPRIDDFCRDALRVTHAYANSPWTLPSHMSLFSSLPETEHGVRFQDENEMPAAGGKQPARLKIFPLEQRHPFLTENLATTFPAFSFNGGINVAAVFGFFRGFELFVETPDDYLDRSAAGALFARAQAHLEAHPLPAAFYFLHTYQVHLPYLPSRRALAEIAAGNSLSALDFEKDLGGIANIFRSPAGATSNEIRALYDAETLDFDRAFGNFIGFLKTRQLYESSLIVLTSDHGEEFFEHGSWAHGTNLFNTQLRVPLIIKFPGRKYAGREFHGNAGLMDVLPTLLDYLGLAREKRSRGSSLMKEFAGGPSAGRSIPASLLRCKHWSALPAKAAVIQGRFKLIRNLPAGPEAGRFFHCPPPPSSPDQLFDIIADPAERRDLLLQNRPRFARTAARLARLLRSGFDRKDPDGALRAGGSDDAIDRLRALGYLR